MAVHHFDVAALTPLTWPNGGGTTREIVSWPADSTPANFDWCASVSTFAASGPLARHPGVDRTLVLLEGDGVRLRSKESHIDHRLDVPLLPFSFSGDAEIYAKLLGGASADFNLLVRHGKLNAVVEVLTSETWLEPASHGLLLAFSGTWRLKVGAGEVHCPQQQGLWWADTPQRVQAAPTHPGTGAILLAVRLDEQVLAE